MDASDNSRRYSDFPSGFTENYAGSSISFIFLLVTLQHFSDECNRLKTAFSRLKYPKHLVNSTIKSFVDSKVCDQQRPLSPAKETDDTVRVVLPFKDQISADIVKEQLKDLSLKVNTTIQPVFASRKIEQELNVKEAKPPIVNEQRVVYNFQCDLCDAGYVGYTRAHLHNRVKGHTVNNSSPPLPNITRKSTGRSLRTC